MLLLTVLTIGLVLLLVGALVVYLLKIIAELEAIGGAPASLLAHVRWGVRAIEVQTRPIEPGVGSLNAGLGQIGEGLAAVQANLRGLAQALRRQGSRS